MGVDFKAKQAEFAAYIRDPGHFPAPADVDPRRMAMYRELFFNNIDGFLGSNFPLLRGILGEAQWHDLARDFFARHSCGTPHFSEIAEEFLDYLQNERRAEADLPFLLELAHYEWVEMALSIAPAEPVYGDAAFAEQVLQQSVSLSPVAWPLAYQYPVHRIGPDFLPQSAPEQPSYLVVYRDADDQVRFMQTTPPTYRLLQLIEQQGSVVGESVLQLLAAELAPQIELDSVLSFGGQTLRELAMKGVLIPAVDV
ncbi:putative DNA-binding domain-containing protein [Methylomonas sp. SURF-2]|uniref:DNA-binding domain-containing protein n=1 Tax=Methylomonas subterranea TaxID=2952225 RepID=A0ABT1TF29_9GAMM|nr:putative DNA-binding domain-containing protein [Methylomonas sp. SURF-2]MCQ8104065.1 putative DNA-binding domain-containing protein [Methylomonas sp. SURF-2]